MKSTHWMFTLSISLLVVLAVPENSYACGVTPAVLGPPLSVSGSGQFVSIGLAPISLFSISTTHDCVCGIGIGMTGSTGPASLLLMNAVLRDSNGNVIQQFDFTLNPITTMGLANGPVLNPGSRWFGFHASVEPFTLPPDGMAFLEFSGTIDPNDRDALNNLTAQIASGVGNGFDPVFDPNDPHRVQYMKTSLQTVPEPATMLLLVTGLAGVGAAVRKRRKAHKREDG